MKDVVYGERLKESFLRWQCRVRQISVREKDGRPSDGMMPIVTLDPNKASQGRSLGHIITILNKTDDFSKLPELRHIVRHTHDLMQRRDKALKFFSEYYYQHIDEFSDQLTAVFAPESVGARQILASQACRLHFSAYTQEYSLCCQAKQLQTDSFFYQASWWHNHMFNPNLSKDVVIISFCPDWVTSTTNQPIMQDLENV